ncbi:carbohydrate ABC transporter permease [Pseudolysinimonas kribbensis]|uniref:Sugar ABC transporter permease n=1 Tax=Pseudolysinimonas kribbensis TaxID=433641 RepID=A0ABQ6K2U8_9MICO|nr:carbohydrate ABC transporter permease [Pseudolysinimonas kribbensis]GMA94950.1 sugar ABC transporter permease [Pseudolysinimonas kribbensis]
MLLVLAVIMASPIVWLISQSLTVERFAFQLPPGWIPVPFTLDNFEQIFPLVPFGQMALNSVIVATLSTGGALLTSVLAAYAFSRLAFRGREFIFITMLTALMVPVQLTVIPVFIMMRNLHLVDTLAALILPALVNVFAIFFLRQYFNSIPRELDEAARIDGAGHLWILFRMLVPLSSPAISAVIIILFQLSWNDYFDPLIFINSPQNMTLPIGLVSLQGGAAPGPVVVVFAAVTLVVVPVLVLFLVFQRQFVASVAASGIRG